LLATSPVHRGGPRLAAAASRLSRAATDQVAARTAEQVFATLGELKGGAAKLGQAMSVFEVRCTADNGGWTAARSSRWP